MLFSESRVCPTIKDTAYKRHFGKISGKLLSYIIEVVWMYFTKKIIWKYVLYIDEKRKVFHHKKVQLRAGLWCNARLHITL
jgi:hypothetical protein